MTMSRINDMSRNVKPIQCKNKLVQLILPRKSAKPMETIKKKNPLRDREKCVHEH